MQRYRGILRRLKRARVARARRGRNGQSGLTLIEVLVSVVVLAVVIAPMFDAFIRGRAMVQHRAEERMALRLIERKVEQLLAAGGSASGDDSDITSVNMTGGVHPANTAITLITRADNDASNDVVGDLYWTVYDITWSDPSGTWDDASYKSVVVTLAWPRGAHRDSVQVTTIVS
jgi:prepilin-type N-terminal cleavage/methylation domain-containing protein